MPLASNNSRSCSNNSISTNSNNVNMDFDNLINSSSCNGCTNEGSNDNVDDDNNSSNNNSSCTNPIATHNANDEVQQDNTPAAATNSITGRMRSVSFRSPTFNRRSGTNYLAASLPSSHNRSGDSIAASLDGTEPFNEADIKDFEALLWGNLGDSDKCMSVTDPDCKRDEFDNRVIHWLRIQADSAWCKKIRDELLYFLSILSRYVFCPAHQHEHSILMGKWMAIIDKQFNDHPSPTTPVSSREIPQGLLLPRCPICLEEMLRIRRTPCNHAYCEHCLNQLSESEMLPRCPLCRRRLFDFDADPDATHFWSIVGRHEGSQ